MTLDNITILFHFSSKYRELLPPEPHICKEATESITLHFTNKKTKAQNAVLLEGAGNPAQAKAGTPQHGSAWNIPRVLPHNGAALFPGFPRFCLYIDKFSGCQSVLPQGQRLFSLSSLSLSLVLGKEKLHPLTPGERKAPCSSVQEESKPLRRERDLSG